MKTKLRYVGLDVHAETIVIAVAEASGEVRSLGTIPNRAEPVAKMVRKLGPVERLRVCYEAGPCGYTLYWQLTGLGARCEVVAPTLIPTRAGDRIKTDRRDAEKLARTYRAGDLTPVWVPDAEHEALRDLLRAREAAKADQLRARHRLNKFLLRHGHRRPDGMRAWTTRHRQWLASRRFEIPALEATLLDYLHEVDHATDRIDRLEGAIHQAVARAPKEMRAVIAALQTLRGVRQTTAATLVAEIGPLSRFQHPRQLMAYSGAIPRVQASGASVRRGSITKTGNAHLRRVLIEAAWAYRYRPSCTGELRKRQSGQPQSVRALAWKAQHRLCGRYRHLAARGLPRPKIVTAVGRELLGFIWAIGTHVETATPPPA
jgi:transposase